MGNTSLDLIGYIENDLNGTGIPVISSGLQSLQRSSGCQIGIGKRGVGYRPQLRPRNKDFKTAGRGQPYF